MKATLAGIFRVIYYILILGLVFFGVGFSKFHLAGPLYLHDLLLVFAVFLTFSRPALILPFPNVVLVGLVSLVYLIISFFTSDARVDLIIRQYAIFGYMICYYILYIKGFRGHLPQAIIFLNKVGLLCVVLQSIFILYRIYFGLSIFADYNYFSPITVLGIIIGSAGFLVYHRSSFKYLLFFGTLLLSATTGHSSSFLAVFVVAAFYFFFRTANSSKAVIILVIVAAVLGLYFFLPQFQDVNAGFRLITWQDTMETIIIDNYGIIGEGFGVPYFDLELIYKLYREVGSEGFFGPNKIDEPYLSSVHNSYLTIFFAIGLLPGIFILLPFYRLCIYLINRKHTGNPDSDFIYLCLIGLSVWVSFNQILEIPHSTGLFWLVYFASLSVSELKVNEREYMRKEVLEEQRET